MTTLGDLTKLIRSKNAGPFTLTVDIMCLDHESYLRLINSNVVSPDRLSHFLNVPSDDLKIQLVESALSIKVSFPRQVASGSPGDSDVFGCQQYGPLVNMEINNM